jgi:hypothetical protein
MGRAPLFEGQYHFHPATGLLALLACRRQLDLPKEECTANSDGNTPPDSTPPVATPLPMSRTQEGFRRDPLEIDLASLGGRTPPPFDHRVGLNTPDCTEAPNDSSDQ